MKLLFLITISIQSEVSIANINNNELFKFSYNNYNTPEMVNKIKKIHDSATNTSNEDSINQLYFNCRELIRITMNFTTFLYDELILNAKYWNKIFKKKINNIDILLESIRKYKIPIIIISKYKNVKDVLTCRNNFSSYLFNSNDELLYQLVKKINDEDIRNNISELIEKKASDLNIKSKFYVDVKKKKKADIKYLMDDCIYKLDSIIKNLDNSYSVNDNFNELIYNIEDFIDVYFKLKSEIFMLLHSRSRLVKLDRTNCYKYNLRANFSVILNLLFKYLYSIIGKDEDLKKIILLSQKIYYIEDIFFDKFELTFTPLIDIIFIHDSSYESNYELILDTLKQILSFHGAVERFLSTENCNLLGKQLIKKLKIYLKESSKQLMFIN
ncbi:hypothetical protein TCON_0891 [Astathelohania contejeani]|uniref:Uncharacterized protein n=1 Tax=Astathelohania contejeani TaxID=164912 RepID=A0ABQ7I0E8_9MICR|nr:hypothetical protein TCON_0891 [Thelohania contejeani]